MEGILREKWGIFERGGRYWGYSDNE